MNRLNSMKKEIINGPNNLEGTQVSGFHHRPVLPSLDEEENYEIEVENLFL